MRPASHSADGTARVVKLAAGGRRLTLSDGFEIDPGPKVRVYLATDESGTTYKDLGELKGSRGDQQYEIPASVSLTRYDTVVFWCVPFSVSLATAQLEAGLTSPAGVSGGRRRSRPAAVTPRRAT